MPSGHSSSMKALFQLAKIIKVANEGWKPDFENEDEYKYAPHFYLENGCQVFVDGVFGWNTSAAVPAPSLLKSRELAEKIALENQELYGQMLFGL